ncbi:MAG: efflux RND transporter periplasmic adaptor subunit [Gammaproteobacteria bacterium]|nr:efflux RND transporter periplasmic adaptor subunit [Gammaproteobacteria bacterium]
MTQVELGTLHQQIEVTGELESSNTATLEPPAVNGIWRYQVKSLAPEGAMVEKGGVVAQLDTSELAQRLAVKTANLETTVQDLKTTKLRNTKNLETLKLDLAEAQMEWEKSKRKVDLSDETVSVIDKQKNQRDAVIAQAKVGLIKKKIDFEILAAKQKILILESDKKKFTSEVAALNKAVKSFTLLAPRSGMLVYASQRGDKVAEGKNIYSDQSFLSISDLQHMQVKLTIPEVESGRVKVGQKLKVRLDANPEKSFSGSIVELGAVFRVKNQDVPLVIFDAVASIDKPDIELMRPGMTAKISIEIANKKPDLLLALDAVQYQRGKAYVYKPGWLGNSKQEVSLGNMGAEQVAILSGLKEGDKVLLP